MMSEKTKSLTNEYERLIEMRDGEGAGRLSAWQWMEQSSAYVDGHPAYISYLPRILDGRARDILADTAITIHGILTKVIKAYQTDETFRQAFHFDPRVEELVALPSPVCDLLPYGRFDVFFDEEAGDVRFIEFNADGSSGMNKTREALNAIAPRASFRSFTQQHQVDTDIETLFDGWVSTFLRLYHEADQAVDNPHIAIIVCADGEGVPLGELSYYAELFRARGCTCSVCDVRSLHIRDSALVCDTPYDGEPAVPIDGIWRFSVIIDMLNHWEECQDFVEAVRQGLVVMIGGFQTQIAHDKQLFAILQSPTVDDILTEQEKAFVRDHLPYTAFLDDPCLDMNEIKAQPQRWVIKPTDWYNGIGVYVGAGMNAREWEEAVDACLADVGPSAYLIQEYCTPEYVPAVGLYGKEDDYTRPPQSFGCLTGMYVFGGVFAGIYNRLGPGADVTSGAQCVVAPTLWVK